MIDQSETRYFVEYNKNNYRAISGKLLSRTWSAVTRVVSADETIMAATVEEVYFEVNSLFYFREKIIETHGSVNQCSKPWFCEILRDTFRDGCQYLRTSVDYPIFLILLQVCKCLDVTSASPTPLRKNFPTFAAVFVSSTETTCVTAHHVRPNNLSHDNFSCSYRNNNNEGLLTG